MRKLILKLTGSTIVRKTVKFLRLHLLVNWWLHRFPVVKTLPGSGIRYRARRVESLALSVEMFDKGTLYSTSNMSGEIRTFADLGCNVGYCTRCALFIVLQLGFGFSSITAGWMLLALFAGNLIARKAPDVLVEAFALASRIGVLDAGRILLGFTRSLPGNWTSWPPHEHTTILEEMYIYFDMPAPAFGLQLVYDNTEYPEMVVPVREGDAVLMPSGYHPNVSVPGHRICFIWAMAAHREKVDRQFGLVNVQPGFGQGGSGLEASRRVALLSTVRRS